MNKDALNLSVNIPTSKLKVVVNFIDKKALYIIFVILSLISILSFAHYYTNGLGLAYNDARSHLDIGRRVVEGLKPGVAQLGSVWLPLPHILMAITIWNDFMWHSGLSGAIVSMISFVITGLIIYKFLKELNVPLFERFLGVALFAANINILYLQSTAMTELLLIATMTISSYELLKWHKNDNILNLIKSAFWVMLSTLVRYDGWFLLIWACFLIVLHIFSTPEKNETHTKKLTTMWLKIKATYFSIKMRYKKFEGIIILFATLAGFGIFLWFMWNLIIFKDPLYFVFGPFSAKAQQDQLASAGVLATKHNLWFSVKFYLYALMFNSNAFLVILGTIGAVVTLLDKKLTRQVRLAITVLLAPLAFNIIALYFGHSVLFIQGLSGDTWFNVRYGIMLMPSISIFIAYMVYKLKLLKWSILGLLLFTVAYVFMSNDAVTIDDARVGSSQKNVSEVSGWLKDHASNEKGFILISAASHDAIIFSSGLPMKRFIHEGTGLYWESATAIPDRWVRWIIMRTYDDNDLTWKRIKETKGFERFKLINHFPFADIYELDQNYINQLQTDAVLKENK